MSGDGPGHARRLDRVRVVVVDDDLAVLSVVAQILERHGATVTAVSTADEALAVVEHERPDVLVSDITMPDKGGYWLIGRIRALPPERGGAIPAAALTGLCGAEHRASILRAGFQYHVAKPIDMKQLIGVVSILALKE